MAGVSEMRMGMIAVFSGLERGLDPGEMVGASAFILLRETMIRLASLLRS